MISEAIIAAIAAGVGAVLAGLGTVIVNVIKAKNEPKIKELELGEKFDSQIQGLKTSLEGSFAEIKESVDDLTDKFDDFRIEQKGYNIVMIRHSIVDVYETYKDQKKIPMPLYQSTIELYDKYKGLGGNSWCHELIEEMKEWNKE